MGENNNHLRKRLLKQNRHLFSHFSFTMSTSPRAQGCSVLYKFTSGSDSRPLPKAYIFLLHASPFHTDHLLTINKPIPFMKYSSFLPLIIVRK